MRLAVALLALVCLAAWFPCHASAQELGPAWTWSRLTATAGGDWQFYASRTGEAVPATRGEFAPCVNLGYSLGNYLTTTASWSYGVSSGLNFARLGVRLLLTEPTGGVKMKPIVTAGADYIAYGHTRTVLSPHPGGELGLSINGAMKMSNYMSLFAAEEYGTASGLFLARVGVRGILFNGGVR
jgi:hypothetical protein